MLMNHLRLSAATGVLIAGSIAGQVQAEDALPFVRVDCGASCAVISPATHFLPVLSGATLVINVAHLPPAPEEAFIGEEPVKCDPVMYRVDTLGVDARRGQIEVGLGDRVELAPGEVKQIVQTIEQKGEVAVMDMRGYRFRSEAPSDRCSLVASGLYYANPNAMPIPFSLLPGSGLTKK